MSYKIILVRSARKDIENLPANEVRSIGKAIDGLASNPRPAGCKKLKGKAEPIWRIRVGNYRVLYLIEDTIRVVEIRKIGHRKDIYE